MQPEDYQKFLNYLKFTLLPNLILLIEARENKVFLDHVGGVQVEVFDMLLKGYWTTLPEKFRKRYDFDAKLDNLVDNLDLLRGIRDFTQTIVELSPEDLEAEVKVATLEEIKAIKAAHDQAKRMQEEVDKKLENQISTELKPQAKEYIERLRELNEELKNDLTAEFESLKPEIAAEIIKQAEPDKKLEATARPELSVFTETLGHVLTQRVKEYLNTETPPPKKEMLKRLGRERIFSNQTRGKITEVIQVRQINRDQIERTSALNKNYVNRCILAAEVWWRLRVPELFENPIFAHNFRRALLEQDLSKVGNIQEFLKEKIIKSVEEARITTIRGREVTPEQVLEIAEQAVKNIPPSPPKQPEVSPLPTLTPPSSSQVKAEREVKEFLETNLTEPAKNLGISQKDLSRVLPTVSSGFFREITQDKEILEFFLPEKEEEVSKEERAFKAAEILARLFKEEGLDFPPEQLKSLAEEGLITDQGLKIESLSDFLSEQKVTIDQLEESLQYSTKSPTFFFTTTLPLPLKPVGLVLDGVGALFPKVKDNLLVGFLGGDKENLKKTRKHYLDLLRKTQREASLEEKISGKTPKYEQLKTRGLGLKNILQPLSQMERAIRKPPFLTRPFISLGNLLRRGSLFLNKKLPHPLSIFSWLKKINFRRVLSPFSPSFPANIRGFAGSFLYQFLPSLFIKSSAGIPFFKFSFAGLKIGLGNLLGRFKNFISQSGLAQFFRGLRSRALDFLGARLGIAGVEALGFRGLFRLGLGFLTKIGSGLGLKLAGLISGPIGWAFTLGKIALDFMFGLPSLLGRFFGREKLGRGGVGGIGVGEMTLQGLNINTILIVGLALVVVIGVLLPLLLTVSLKSVVSVALPFGLKK